MLQTAIPSYSWCVSSPPQLPLISSSSIYSFTHPSLLSPIQSPICLFIFPPLFPLFLNPSFLPIHLSLLPSFYLPSLLPLSLPPSFYPPSFSSIPSSTCLSFLQSIHSCICLFSLLSLHFPIYLSLSLSSPSLYPSTFPLPLPPSNLHAGGITEWSPWPSSSHRWGGLSITLPLGPPSAFPCRAQNPACYTGFLVTSLR